MFLYKDHQLKVAIKDFQEKQLFIQEQVTKFGVLDEQFEDILAGRSITLEDIEQSQTRVDSLLHTIDELNKLDPSNKGKDSMNLERALEVLGL